ncbi:MAG: hypothetical protein PVH61_04985 [Candidatus Aminicenantes bacterium]
MRRIRSVSKRQYPSPALTCVTLVFFLVCLCFLGTSWAMGQEKLLENLLKKGVDTLLGKGQIDSIRIEEEGESRLVLKVRYSKLKVTLGVRMSAEVLDYNSSPLPGFDCDKKILTRKKGSAKLTIIYQGTSSHQRVNSYGIQVKLFITSAQSPTAEKLKEYSKDWIADPNGNTGIDGYVSEFLQKKNRGATQKEEVIIEPEPLFNPEEFTTKTQPAPIGPKTTVPQTVPETTVSPAVKYQIMSVKPQKPTIKYFRASSTKIKKGGSVILSWHTVGATTVRLVPGGMTSKTGSKKVTPTRTTIYTLYAKNNAGQVLKRIKINVSPAVLKLKLNSSAFKNINKGGKP